MRKKEDFLDFFSCHLIGQGEGEGGVMGAGILDEEEEEGKTESKVREKE